MVTKLGDAVSITFNGVKFAIPKDCEPVIFDGGETITETQAYGDGTADPYVSMQIPRITALKCKVSDDNGSAFKEAKRTTLMPIVLECTARSFELTGCIVGEGGISGTKRVTDDFEVHALDGGGIRES